MMACRVRSLIAVALTVLAVSAVVASAAPAAAPEFINEKGANPTGKFTMKSGLTTWYSKANKTTMVCTSDLITGQITGPKTWKWISTKYFGCMATNKKTETKCSVKSPKAEAGEVAANELKGELGTVKKAATPKEDEIGLLLKAATGSTLVTLEGTCLPNTPANLEGGVICKTEPVETFSLTGKLVCAVTAEEQAIKKFEGGAEQTLKLFGLAAALEGTEEVTFEEKLKITAP